MKILNLLLVNSLVLSSSIAQDIHFSQIEQTPQLLNPGLIGLNHAFEGIVNYRTQWNSIGESYNTLAASIDGRFTEETNRSNGLLAGGIQFFNDKSGAPNLSTTSFTGSIAYHLILDKSNSIGIGLNGGFNQKTLENNSGRWSSQYDGMSYVPATPSNEILVRNQFSYADIGTGIVYGFRKNRKINQGNSNEFTLGLAAYHLNRPEYTFSNSVDRLGVRWSGFVSAKVNASTLFSILPAIYFQKQQQYTQVLIGTGFKYLMREGSKITGYNQASGLTFGLFHRWKDAMVCKLGVEISSLSVGMSYDFTVSNLSQIQKIQGGMEFFLKYSINDKSLWRNRL